MYHVLVIDRSWNTITCNMYHCHFETNKNKDCILIHEISYLSLFNINNFQLQYFVKKLPKKWKLVKISWYITIQFNTVCLIVAYVCDCRNSFFSVIYRFGKPNFIHSFKVEKMPNQIKRKHSKCNKCACSLLWWDLMQS